MAGKHIKIVDSESGELLEYKECQTCDGMGGADWSTDCEAYDDWHDCEDCGGEGMVKPGYFDRDIFMPERDALTPND